MSFSTALAFYADWEIIIKPMIGRRREKAGEATLALHLYSCHLSPGRVDLLVVQKPQHGYAHSELFHWKGAEAVG